MSLKTEGEKAMRESEPRVVKHVFWLLSAIFPILAASSPALAVNPVTPEQLRRILATAAASPGHADDVAAKQLGNVSLTVRLAGAQLRELMAQSSGPKTTQALEAITDVSAFLEPPAAELPSIPAPDFAMQKAIIGRTINYVTHTLPALPNFLAVRVTEHFVDSLRGMDTVDPEPRGGLFWVGGSRIKLGFRDGRETDDPSTQTRAASLAGKAKTVGPPNLSQGLSSWGEFGPVLGVVLLDAARGKLSWTGWHEEDGKPVAVFQFAVDRAKSHYSLNYCCDAARRGVVDAPLDADSATVWQPGYHGRLEIDPDSGALLRITIEADLRAGDPIERAALMVEYAKVKIGDRVEICPVRSVALSVADSQFMSRGVIESIARLRLNHTEFVDYHRFGSRSSIVNGEDAETASNDTRPLGAADSGETRKTASEKPEAPDGASVAGANGLPRTDGTIAAAVDSEPEMAVVAGASLPGADAVQPWDRGKAGGFTLQVTTRLVDLALVATDKRGNPITDLKPDEIEVYDNGRRQQLRVFHRSDEDSEKPPLKPARAEMAGTYTNAVSQGPGEAPESFILLLDASHLAYADLNNARSQVIDFLKATRSSGQIPGGQIALYSMDEHGFHVLADFTSDRASVMRTLAAWTPGAAAVAQAQALDRRNNQQFDTVHKVEDLAHVNGNNEDTPEGMATVDPELRQMGANPLRAALEGMLALARHFSSLPGHKSLVWISGDSALEDFEDQAVGIEKGNQQFAGEIAHVGEALNEAHISLYAVNASALQTAAISAELENRNVELDPTSAINSAPGGAPRNPTPGRLTAQMQQNTRVIQGPVRLLTESTGGRAVDKGGGLAKTLAGIDRESVSLYELGFNPDSAADGKYHRLQVKVAGRRDVRLRYRSGYLYSEEAVAPKERLREAVWSPKEANAISLTAKADTSAAGSFFDLRIGFAGLALEKQPQDAVRWRDRLYIFIAERNDASQKAQVSGDTLQLSLKQATYESGMPEGIAYRHAVKLQSSLDSVRVVVVDGNSGKMGSVTIPGTAFRP